MDCGSQICAGFFIFFIFFLFFSLMFAYIMVGGWWSIGGDCMLLTVFERENDNFHRIILKQKPIIQNNAS